MDGRAVEVGVRKQRFVLAVLLLEVNRLVPSDRLISLMWPDGCPRSARAVLHTQVSRLRAMLTEAHAERHDIALVSDGPGYLLRCDPQRVDAHRFRTLCAQARTQEDDRRVATLAEALTLWRGPVMAGLDADGLGRDLDEARLGALEDRFDAELRLGRHREIVDELTALTAEHPDRQHLVGQLMLALHRSQRTGEALQVYRDLYRLLDDELGIAPSAELQRVQEEILQVEIVTRLPMPQQLPADVPAFVGRCAPIRALDDLIGPRPILISAISGTAGVGKTALAVHWAHRVKARFPDGQLYVNLRGYDPSDQALDAFDVLGTFLRSLGVAAEDIPAELEARAALYRSILAGKSMLIVLDNARTARQVQPLLPASQHSAVVVTSRDALSSLVVQAGAVRLPLVGLDLPEALDLMRSLLGDARVEAEPEAVAELCALCGRLPLALRIAGELVSLRAGESIAELVAELRDDRARLSMLSTSDGDERTAMRAVFDWSYRALPVAAQQAFGMLALHRGPHVGVGAASALLGVPDARRVLDTLVHANLLESAGPGRYQFHDLLRLFAADQPVTDADAALERLLSWYLGTARNADDALAPGRLPVPMEVLTDGPDTGVRFASQQEALAWFDIEHANLSALIHRTGSWRLAAVTGEYYYVRRLWTDWDTTHRTCLETAERDGDTCGVAWMLSNLGVLALEQHREREAVAFLERDLELLRGADLDTSIRLHLQGLVTTTLGHAMRRLGELERSVDFHTESLRIHQATGNAWGEGETLINLATTRAALNDHRRAVALLSEAVEVERRIGNWCRLGVVLGKLAHAQQLAGDLVAAAGTYQEACRVLIDSGDRWGAAWSLVHLGDVELSPVHWDRAETLFEELNA